MVQLHEVGFDNSQQNCTHFFDTAVPPLGIYLKIHLDGTTNTGSYSLAIMNISGNVETN